MNGGKCFKEGGVPLSTFVVHKVFVKATRDFYESEDLRISPEGSECADYFLKRIPPNSTFV